jgi:hypothetical protein
MNTKNRVFKKLAEETKVELSVQKVELGISEDIKRGEKIADALKSVSSSFSKEFLNIEKKINDLRYNLDVGGLDKAYLTPAKSIKKELERASLTNIKLYQDLKNFIPVFEKTIDEAKKMDNKLKSF